MLDKVTDVVVIGFGGAGAAAAIEAADAGLEVAILEKMHKPGGATAMSGGVVYGAGTSVQRAAGITDTPDEMYNFYMATDGGMKDPELVRVLAIRSAEAIEWLIRLGMSFDPADLSFGGAERELSHITPAKPRTHWPRSRVAGGPALFAVLREAVKARNIDVVLETTATELVTNSRNEVIGVRALSQGKGLDIRARRAVVLADGGFSCSPEMLKKHWAWAPLIDAGKVEFTHHPGVTGDCTRMAMALGADLCGMGGTFAYPRVYIPVRSPMAHSVEPLCPSIFVSRAGRRFVNEDTCHGSLSAALDNRDFVAFQIFDDNAIKQVSIPRPRMNRLVSAPTVGELAEGLRIPAETLESTISYWNKYAEVGEDPEFGKTGVTVGPIKTPPFWGGEMQRVLHGHPGGLRTNTEAQVLHVLHGKPIPRLFAAGQITGGRFGHFYPGSGGFLADCFVYGRIAGQNAAKETPLE